MFLTLLRKDWRLAKPAFLLMIALFFVPSVVGLVVTVYSRIFEERVPLLQYSRSDHSDLMALFVGGSWLCIFAAPAVAGCQFARERRERTSEFLGALPVSRKRIIQSKVLVTTCLLKLPLLLGFLAVISSLATDADAPGEFHRTLVAFGLFVVSFLGVCGLAWLFSCILSSEVLATTAALLVSATLAFKIYLVFQVVPSLKAMNPSSQEAAITWSIAILFGCFAIAGFTAGTLIAIMRRTL